MSLRIIYGRAGTGKSSFCFSEISKKINKENKIIIITPEQFSFTAEKRLLSSIKEEAVCSAEVVTLSRMAYRVMQEVGGINKTNLSKCGKAMLIYSILVDKKDDLKFLGKTDENIDLIMRAFTEFKQHNISYQQLGEEIEQIDDIYLQTKLKDMELLYKSFENHIVDKYIDETDKITILANEIANTDIVKDAIIYIDEFAGFTSQEYLVILEFLKIAKQVNITVCLDELNESDNIDTDIFYFNKKMAMKLIQLAKDYNIEIEDPIFLLNGYRFKNQELVHLEKNISNIKIQKYEQKPENIKLFLAKNQYSEIEYIAKQIVRLVRDNKLRYKDISIIANNQETYATLIRAIFSKYEIPFFVDEKRELNQNGFVQYCLSILEVLNSRFSQESVINYLKSGYVDIDIEDVFELENYVQKWGIDKKKFINSFEKEIDTNKDKVEKLDRIREQIIIPLVKLENEIKKEKTVKNITSCLYEFILLQNIEQKLNNKILELEEAGLVDLSREYFESYKCVMDIFDQMVVVFEDENITIDKYLQIFKIGLRNSSLGKIPGTADQVTIGSVDRSRSHKVKVVFIIGLNDGAFPMLNKDEGFFDDNDREILKQDGIELAKGTLENLYEENFNIYKAFSTAEEKLFLTYSSSDSEGKTLRPSTYVKKIKNIFPFIYEESDVVTKNYELTSIAPTYEELIENISNLKNANIEEVWYLCYNYFANHEEWKDRLNKDIKALEYTNLPECIEQEKIDKLYGNTLKTSVSRLEQYRRCPFSYFLKYGLKLKEKEKLEVHSFDTGSFMHDVIDEFFTTLYENGESKLDVGTKKEMLHLMTEEEIEKRVDEIIENKLTLPKNYIFTSKAKYLILVKRLKKLISRALFYIIEGLRNSDFVLESTETEFGNSSCEYKPIVVNLENGKKVEIIGKIDRMDTAKSKDGKYLRIIDYKSSAKNIDLNEVYAGLQIQLLTYLDAVCKEEDLLPAGILYFGLLEQSAKVENRISEEEIEEIIRKNFKMKGLILADVNVIKMQDNSLESGASKIIPASITKGGQVSKKGTSGVDSEEFKILQDYIQVVIKQISNEILNGKIDINPYNNKGKKPCDYCEYKSICCFDTKQEGNVYNYIGNQSNDDILKKMKGS